MRTQWTVNTKSGQTRPTRLFAFLLSILLVTATLPSGVVAAGTPSHPPADLSTPASSMGTFQIAWNDSTYRGATGTDPTATTVAVENGTVYAGTRADASTGYLTRYVNGTAEWDVATADRIPSGLAATDSTVVYGADATAPGGLVERDTAGTETNTVATSTLTTDSVVADGVVYSTGADGALARTVRAHTLGGTTVWNDTGGGVAQFPSLVVAPDRERLFVSHGDAVTARDTANGSVVDTLDESGVSYDEVAVSPARNRLYAAVDVDNRTHIDAYALDTLSRVSRTMDVHADGTEVATLAYAPGSDAVVSVTLAGEVAVLDADDESELGRTTLPTGDLTDAAVGAVDGTLAVAYAAEPEVGLLDTGLPAGDLTGRIVTADGRALPNATVEVLGVNYSALSPTEQTLQQRADELLADARNATPPTWNPDRTLVSDTGNTGTGGVGVFDRATGRYVALHTPTDWGATGPLSDPRLETPRLQVPAGEPLRVSVWNADAGDSLVADGVDRNLPGETVEGTAIIDRLDATGDVVSTVAVETTGEYDVGGPLALATHHYGTVTLAPGFYRVQPADDGASYTIVAGDPAAVAQTMEQDLRDDAGRLTEQATDLREHLQSGVFTSRTIRADSTGRFAVSLPSSVETVSVQAYRADGVLADASDPSLGTLRDEFDARARQRASAFDEDGRTGTGALPDTPAVHVSTRPRQVDVPASSVTVRTRELSTPPYANASRASQTYDRLREFFENQSFAGVTPAMQQAVAETVTTELRGVYADLAGVIRANPVLRERYLDLSGRTEVPAPAALSRAELRTAIATANQVLYETAPTDAVDAPEVDVGAGTGGESDGETDSDTDATETVSLAWSLPDAGLTSGTDVEALNVSVVANYANGTTRAVADDYLTVDPIGPSGTDATNVAPVVRLSAFPLGETDPSSVTFHLRVSGPETLAERRSTVVNPTIDADDVPELAAVDVSSLSPGPDEEVRVEIVPAEDGRVRHLAGAEVFSPDGSVVDIDSTNVSDGDTVTFATQGGGLYRIRLQVADLDGRTHTATLRVRAVERGTDAPPTLRAVDTPLGTVAVAGDGVTDGRVSVDETGVRDVSLTLSGDADRTPPWVHLHTASLSAPPDATTRVDVEHADGDVNQSVGVVLHRRGVGTDALAYRGAGEDVDQPVTRDGSTRYGQLDGDGESATLRTYSETDGGVTVRVVNAPSLGERVEHRLRVLVSGVA